MESSALTGRKRVEKLASVLGKGALELRRSSSPESGGNFGGGVAWAAGECKKGLECGRKSCLNLHHNSQEAESKRTGGKTGRGPL